MMSDDFNYVGSTSEDEEPKSFEVESILDYRIKNGVRQFKIRWVGYTPKDDSWEDEKHLDCPAILNSYLESNPMAASVKPKKKKNEKRSTVNPISEFKKMGPESIVSQFDFGGKLHYKVIFRNGTYGTISQKKLREIYPIIINMWRPAYMDDELAIFP